MKVVFGRFEDNTLINIKAFEDIEIITQTKDKNDNDCEVWSLIDEDDIEYILRCNVWTLHSITNK